MGRYEAFEISTYLRISLYVIYTYVCKYQHKLPSDFSSVPTAKCEDFVRLDFVAARKAIQIFHILRFIIKKYF